MTSLICEVESFDKLGDDTIFDINILPNRAHDLLSHQGIARELASLLDIKFIDPTPKYKIPEAKPTDLKIKVELGNPLSAVGYSQSLEPIIKRNALSLSIAIGLALRNE